MNISNPQRRASAYASAAPAYLAPEPEPPSSAWSTVAGALSLAGGAIGAYHGYKRNESVGWAVGWSVLGAFFPVVVIPIAFAQGLSAKGK